MKTTGLQPPHPLPPDHGASEPECADETAADKTSAMPTSEEYRFAASLAHRPPD